jgi:type I restriction enzyme S subunit
LDLLHSVISKKKEQLRELDNLAQSLFYQMFGDESQWESATLKEVCSSIVRGPFGSALKKDFFVPKNDTTYKVYEQKHAIQKDAFIGSYYITKEKFAELKRFEVFPNDIIMSCSGTIGELFVIPNGAEKGVMNQALLKFHLNELITIPYFMFIMEYVKGKMTIQGCGLQNIGSVKEICKIDFPLPPLSLQQSFAAKVSAIEAQKQAITQSIQHTEALLAQRMDQYFS